MYDQFIEFNFIFESKYGGRFEKLRCNTARCNVPSARNLKI